MNIQNSFGISIAWVIFHYVHQKKLCKYFCQSFLLSRHMSYIINLQVSYFTTLTKHILLLQFRLTLSSSLTINHSQNVLCHFFTNSFMIFQLSIQRQHSRNSSIVYQCLKINESDTTFFLVIRRFTPNLRFYMISTWVEFQIFMNIEVSTIYINLLNGLPT